MSERALIYLAHPLAPTAEELAEYKLYPEPHATAYHRNLQAAMRWLAWLQRQFPETTFIAPWIASILSGADDAADPKQREAGLVDDCTTVKRCDGLILVGDRVGSGGRRESAVSRKTWDLTKFVTPPDVVVEGCFIDWANAHALAHRT